LSIAIAATLNRHDELLLAVEEGRHGISDSEILDILGEVLRRADSSVAELVSAVMQKLVRPD
jgi:hypothetical protein